MYINEIVKNALKEHFVSVSANVCKENPLLEEYVVFNYEDETPELYEGDIDAYDATYVQVHHFIKGNPKNAKPTIRQALRNAGFTISGTPQEIYEKDTGYTHSVITAYIVGYIDDEGGN